MTTKHVSRAVCALGTSKQHTPVKVINEYGRVTHVNTRVTLSDESSLIELTIDLAALIDYLGRRALHSKSGVSKIQGGLIKAECIGGRTVTITGERDIQIPAYYKRVEGEGA